MLEILKLSEFEEKDFTWKSFPNHAGHKDSAGCFRCHDGKHFNEKGEAIRLQCTLCHDIPQVTVDGTLKTVASTTMPGLTPPESHGAPNWMREHRLSLDDSCKMCHGPVKFGNDGGSFCSNPGVPRALVAGDQPQRRAGEGGGAAAADAHEGGRAGQAGPREDGRSGEEGREEVAAARKRAVRGDPGGSFFARVASVPVFNFRLTLVNGRLAGGAETGFLRRPAGATFQGGSR